MAMSGRSAAEREQAPRLGAWVARMAWRDARGHVRTLILCGLCLVCGLAALTAITSFRRSLQETVNDQARALLGADLEFTSRRPFSPEVESWLGSLPGQSAREVRFNSMAWFPGQRQTRLVRVRALEAGFPFYGQFETDPSPLSLTSSEQPVAVLEDTLMRQFGISPGDTIQLGKVGFTVVGRFLRAPGEHAIGGLFAPRVFINLQHVEETGLLGRGSLVWYSHYQALPGGLTPEMGPALEQAERELLRPLQVELNTVERQKRQLGRALDRMYDFLNLVGFVALLLGGIGVAGAVHVYLQERVASVALLRCLGASVFTTFRIYLLQILAVAAIAALLGAGFGLAVQFALPAVLAGFLPFEVRVQAHPGPILGSAAFGLLVAFLFALLPLLAVRRVSPLHALRAAVDSPRPSRDPWTWATVAAIAAVVVGFSLTQTSRPVLGWAFVGALALSLALLAGSASLLRALCRWVVLRSASGIWRHGMANLFRPQNRTLLVLVTLGMGTFLIHTLHLARDSVLYQLSVSDRRGDPNLILFDIQPDQVEAVHQTVREAGFPVIESVPIVTMRLLSIRNRAVAELRSGRERRSEDWALDREYRSTWREGSIGTETVVAGAMEARWSGEGAVPVSIERGLATNLGVWVGDPMVFDIQGVPVETVIGSIREVDWNQVRTNFFFVFPGGVLEEAPAFYGLVTRTPDRLATAALQEKLVLAFPNVSAIDLSLVLDTLGSVLDRAAFVIRFMSAFTVLTGMVVLAGSILTSRYQRMRESALLKCLGASSGRIRAIMAIEYGLLGLVSGVAGVLLATAGGWALARFVFATPFSFSLGSGLLVVAALGGATLGTGLLNSRGIAQTSPLVMLREET